MNFYVSFLIIFTRIYSLVNNQSGQHHRHRIELRSSMAFQCLWVFQLDRCSTYNALECSLLNNNEWLLVDGWRFIIFEREIHILSTRNRL
jgi:hypothetical protein